MTNWTPPFLDSLLLDEPLDRYSALRLGGRAEWLYIARDSRDALVRVVQSAWEHGVEVHVLGGGANVLISDHGLKGLVVINQLKHLDCQADYRLLAHSGLGLGTLAQLCAKRGWSGFEWAVSVPGTLGGAIVNNAGAHGGEMQHAILRVEWLDAEQGLQSSTLEQLQYGYRTSYFKQRADKRFLILQAELQFQPADHSVIRSTMEQFIAHRKRTQPKGASLGSIYKNPPNDYAGRLIEQAGLKGYRIGDAGVSDIHANFFINLGNATAHDYYRLIRYVQAQVYQQTGILLETEVECLGEMG